MEQKISGIRKALIVFFSLALAASLGAVFFILAEERSTRENVEALHVMAAAPAASAGDDMLNPKLAENPEASDEKPSEGQEEAPEVAPKRLMSMDFEPLTSLYPDIKAWITLADTPLDYPVMQADDNEYYLKRMYDGKSSKYGSIFMDYRSLSDFSGRNTVIYGHNMRNRTMFSLIREYRKQAFFDEHPLMTIYTPEGDLLFEAVSGTIENGDREFVRFEFESDEDFLSYVQGFKDRSLFKGGAEVSAGDRIVSLCTCSYEAGNTRFMVIGKISELYE